MALLTKIGTINGKTTTGSQAYTGVGFQPKLVMLFNGNPQTTTGDGCAGLLLGAADSSTQFCSTYFDRDAQGTSSTASRMQTALYCTASTGGAVDTASLTSLDSDGFTLNWTNADPLASQIYYLAIGGGSEVQCKVGSISSRTTTGSQSTTGVGFQPECLLIFGTNATSTNSAAATASLSFGVADGTSQYAMSSTSTDNQANAQTAGANGNQIIKLISGSTGADTVAATLSSFDADGFTLSYPTVLGSARLFTYVALRGVNLNLTTINPNTTTTVTPYFRPKVSLAYGHDSNASNAECVLGISDGTNTRGNSFFSENGPTTTNAFTVQSAGPIVLDYSTGGTTQVSGTVSQNSYGSTFTWGTNDGTSRTYYFLQLGSKGVWSFPTSGGITISGAASSKPKLRHTGTGGITTGGSSGLRVSPIFSTSGGITIAGTASSRVTLSHSSTGGITIAGTATALPKLNHQGGGEITTSGSADSRVTLSHSATGGVTLSGSATSYQSGSLSYTASGGVTIQGEAGVRLYVASQGQGAIALSGAASSQVRLNAQPTGGIALQGQAEARIALPATTSGGITLSGSAGTRIRLTHSSTGGVTIQGDGPSRLRLSHLATGGVILGGQAQYRYDAEDVAYQYQASGGITLSGSALSRLGTRRGIANALIIRPRYQASLVVGPRITANRVTVQPRYEGDLVVEPRYSGNLTVTPQFSEG